MLVDHEQTLTIQQVSQLTGLTAHTQRYYERIALLTPVGRAANGHRHYRKQDVERITLLNYLRSTGMPLEQMKTYAALLDQGNAGVPQRVTLLHAHRNKVIRQIEEMCRSPAVIEYKLSVLAEQTK